MRLTLETTYRQTIDVSDDIGRELIREWIEGETFQVDTAFDGAVQTVVASRLYVEPEGR